MAKNKTAEPKVYIVETPVEGFCGIGAGGIHFAYGKAEVHEGWVLDWFKEHGYKVTLKADYEKNQAENQETEE